MCLKAAKKKIISTSVSLLYVHHCVTTGDPSASKYSACPRNTPTAEWEVHTSIYLMSTCDGWPHLLEIPTWEAPPTHSVWRCQHILLWSGCSVVYPVGCFMEISLYIKLITSEIIIASRSLHSVWIFTVWGGGAGQVWKKVKLIFPDSDVTLPNEAYARSAFRKIVCTLLLCSSFNGQACFFSFFFFSKKTCLRECSAHFWCRIFLVQHLYV